MKTNLSLRKFRFGLKTMFVLTLGVAIGFTLQEWAALLTSQLARLANGQQAGGLEFAGLKLSEEPQSTFASGRSRYRGGMRINSVNPNSSAAKEGILPGDVLVGMHQWETATEQDIEFIKSRPNLEQLGKMKFYVLRGENTLYGHVSIASD